MKEVIIKEYTVSEIVTEIKKLIENNFYYIKIIGEISDLKISSNGHSYFNLKDNSNLINAVLFSGTKNRFQLENGISIKAFARLTIYPGRSNYQLIIEAFEINGEGELLKIFEEKKKKLETIGLFDKKHKLPIPQKIKTVGIITSPTGAAIKDIEVKLENRKPIKLFLYPAIVQGEEAEKSIIDGIEYFNNLKNKPDVIVITRGGGSLEDLMCFNGEKLAYTIYNSEIPIITAIGHEVDYTIADFVADFRLPTPTAVAEFITEQKTILNNKVDTLVHKIRIIIANKLNKKIKKLNHLIHKSLYILKNKKLEIINKKFFKITHIFNNVVNKILNNYKNRARLLINSNFKLKKYNKNYFLKNGFALIEKNNTLITKTTKIEKDDILIINIFDKKIKVKIIDFIKN